MSTRHSTRLNKALKNTNTNAYDDDEFVVDDEKPPSLNGEVIDNDDYWVTVWLKLMESGWGWTNVSVLSSYYNSKPNITTT